MRYMEYDINMQTSLILHGHFYQPPRENPWTDLIPRQPSAAPFHDWNRRITQECYAANCYSRYLGAYGEILNISNNYEIFSFNFGPTLMNWLKNESPNVYMKIIEADLISRKRNNGHGNAIAQVYNHVIMPLASADDKRIQIRWGIEDFRSHFNRDPEGMWLAETAINQETVDCLIEAGIRFVILSPWQAESVEDPKTGKMTKVTDPLSVSRSAYRLTGSRGGTLAAFFYNHVLAQGISFGHYLQNADSFYEKLKFFAGKNENDLLHTATDGEIYGHHEPYGDMCIAALRKKIEADGESAPFRFTNYGYYLEQHPPKLTAILQKGEENRGSSWSCFHGVSRWYKNCGCSTGGPTEWNQEWRTPLRDAFDRLRAEIDILFRTQIADLSGESPQTVAGQYAAVLCGKTAPEAFAARFLKKNTPKNRIDFLNLLEGFKLAQFMYTSCGWFFAELSGIEPVQNMCYAARAAEIFQRYTEKDLTEILCSRLENAVSNLPEQGNGRDIFNRYVKAQEYSIEKLAAINILLHYFKLKPVRSNGLTPINIRNRTITIRKDSTTEIFKLRYKFTFPDQTFRLQITNNGETRSFGDFAFDEYIESTHVRAFIKSMIFRLDKADRRFINNFSIINAINPSILAGSIATVVYYRLQYLCAPDCRYGNRHKEIALLMKTKWIRRITEMPSAAHELERNLHIYLNRELIRLFRKKDIKGLNDFIQLIEIIDRSPLTLNKAFLQNYVFSTPAPAGIVKEAYDHLRTVLGLGTKH